jgi:hypothetical protein
MSWLFSQLRLACPCKRALLAALTVLTVLATWLPATVQAHSSSNSYLTLSANESGILLRTDINLRDIDLLFDLDSNRDGQVTWGETRLRSDELRSWISAGVKLSASGTDCALSPADLQLSQRADGLYLSAESNVRCTETSGPAKGPFTLRYGLIFATDNLHRGLLKVELPGYESSAMLSPEQPQAELTRAATSVLSVLQRYIVQGVWHIWIGIDHILFLLSLLVLAPLIVSKRKVNQWQAHQTLRPALVDVLAVVTAFTLAHSITLGLAVLKWLEPPADLIEPAIAISVVLAALNNLMGWVSVKRWKLAFVFGLIHGFGFANVLLELGLPAAALATALAGFNIGVELGQLAIVAVFFPVAWLLRNTLFYRWVVVTGGSLLIALIGLLWTLQRTGLLGD